MLATLYYNVGISPERIVFNHLNQPRELVKGDPIMGLLA